MIPEKPLHELFPEGEIERLQRLAEQNHPDLQPSAQNELARNLEYYGQGEEELVITRRQRAVPYLATIAGLGLITGSVVHQNYPGVTVGSVLTSVGLGRFITNRHERYMRRREPQRRAEFIGSLIKDDH